MQRDRRVGKHVAQEQGITPAGVRHDQVGTEAAGLELPQDADHLLPAPDGGVVALQVAVARGRGWRRRAGSQLDPAQGRASAPQVAVFADGDDPVRPIGGEARRDMAELCGKVLMEEEDVHRWAAPARRVGFDPVPSFAGR